MRVAVHVGPDVRDCHLIPLSLLYCHNRMSCKP